MPSTPSEIFPKVLNEAHDNSRVADDGLDLELSACAGWRTENRVEALGRGGVLPKVLELQLLATLENPVHTDSEFVL